MKYVISLIVALVALGGGVYYFLDSGEDFDMVVPIESSEVSTTILEIYEISEGDNYVLFYPYDGSCEDMCIVIGETEYDLVEDSGFWKCARKIVDEGSVGSGTSLQRILLEQTGDVLLRAKSASGVSDMKVKKIGGVGFNNWFEPD